MEGVHALYARHGIILVPVGLNELLLYGPYSGMAGAAHGSNSLPPRFRLRRWPACLRLFQPGGGII